MGKFRFSIGTIIGINSTRYHFVKIKDPVTVPKETLLRYSLANYVINSRFNVDHEP